MYLDLCGEMITQSRYVNTSLLINDKLEYHIHFYYYNMFYIHLYIYHLYEKNGQRNLMSYTGNVRPTLKDFPSSITKLSPLDRRQNTPTSKLS